MKRVTAKDLMIEQSRRYKKVKESEQNLTEAKKGIFRRKPYYMTVGSGSCGKKEFKRSKAV